MMMLYRVFFVWVLLFLLLPLLYSFNDVLQMIDDCKSNANLCMVHCYGGARSFILTSFLYIMVGFIRYNPMLIVPLLLISPNSSKSPLLMFNMLPPVILRILFAFTVTVVATVTVPLIVLVTEAVEVSVRLP